MSTGNKTNPSKVNSLKTSSMNIHININLLFVITIVFMLFSNTFSAECRKSNWCMACSTTTENKCDACFNWANSSYLPRAINTSNSPQDCIYPQSMTISGCKWYSGLVTTTASNRTETTCNICAREFLVWDSVNYITHCTDILPFGLVKINNCYTTVQFSTATNTTVGCRMCKKNYSGSGWDSSNNSGSRACVKNRAITNCEYSYMLSDSSYECYTCDRDYAVSSTKTSCLSYTLDPNCRSLHAGTEGCYYCWHAYYWDRRYCILGSGINSKIIWILGSFYLILNIFQV